MTPAAEAILSLLKSRWMEIESDFLTEDAPVLALIAQDSARWGIEKAGGNPGADATLAHLKAQVALLAAKAHIRESKRLEATLLEVVTIAGEVLGKFLTGAL